MAAWALAEQQSLVLDAGCGTGVLLSAAARIAPGAQLVGVDNDPLAVAMTKEVCRIGGFDVQVLCTDFLLEDIGHEPTAILCNPPYTRHQLRTAEHKDAVAESIGRPLGIAYTRTASLHAIFLARAIEIAGEGARIAFVTPSQWLDTRYGRAVKDYVESQARIVAVIELDAGFFPDVQTSAAITLIRKGQGDTSDSVRIRINDPRPDPEAVLKEIESKDGQRRRKGQPRAPRGERLGDLARVRRGVATGHNRFFVLSEQRRLAHGIPRRAVEPCIASPRLFNGTSIMPTDLGALGRDIPRWLLTVGSRHSADAILRYLEYGKTLGAQKTPSVARPQALVRAPVERNLPDPVHILEQQKPPLCAQCCRRDPAEQLARG